MTSKKFFYVLLGLCGLAIISMIGMAVLGNIVLEKQSARLVDAKIAQAVVDEQEKSFNQAKKDLTKYKELNEISKSVVPQDKDQAKTIREIVKLAEESGVNIETFTFSTSTLGQKAPAASSSSGSSSGGTGDSATKAPAQPPVTQVKPVEGLSGVYSMEIIISSSSKNPSSYYNFLQFLERLEGNRRTAHITNINLVPDKKRPGYLTFTLTLKLYIKPEAKK